jgi:hypothetical protein
MIPDEGIPKVLKSDVERVRQTLRDLNLMTYAEDYLLRVDTSIPLSLQKKNLLRPLTSSEANDNELLWWRDFLTGEDNHTTRDVHSSDGRVADSVDEDKCLGLNKATLEFLTDLAALDDSMSLKQTRILRDSERVSDQLIASSVQSQARYHKDKHKLLKIKKSMLNERKRKLPTSQ